MLSTDWLKPVLWWPHQALISSEPGGFYRWPLRLIRGRKFLHLLAAQITTPCLRTDLPCLRWWGPEFKILSNSRTLRLKDCKTVTCRWHWAKGNISQTELAHFNYTWELPWFGRCPSIELETLLCINFIPILWGSIMKRAIVTGGNTGEPWKSFPQKWGLS